MIGGEQRQYRKGIVAYALAKKVRGGLRELGRAQAVLCADLETTETRAYRAAPSIEAIQKIVRQHIEAGHDLDQPRGLAQTTLWPWRRDDILFCTGVNNCLQNGA